MDLVEIIFREFFEQYSFEKVDSKDIDVKSFENSDVKIDFLYDKRYDELSIAVSKRTTEQREMILSILQKIKPSESRDVFEYLRHEFTELDDRLSDMKAMYQARNHAFLLLTVCSVCFKRYDDIVQMI